jgi:hypothetical protein
VNLHIFVEYKDTMWRLYDCIYPSVWWKSLELGILNLVWIYLINLPTNSAVTDIYITYFNNCKHGDQRNFEDMFHKCNINQICT